MGRLFYFEVSVGAVTNAVSRSFGWTRQTSRHETWGEFAAKGDRQVPVPLAALSKRVSSTWYALMRKMFDMYIFTRISFTFYRGRLAIYLQ
jgi:hypothetical protein